MLASNASKYEEHMQDLAEKTLARVRLRLEAVFFVIPDFPKYLRYWDEKRHCKAKWNKKDYVELHLPTQTPSAAALAASHQGNICAQIEELELMYSHNLKYREHGMPSSERCVEHRVPRVMPKDHCPCCRTNPTSAAMTTTSSSGGAENRCLGRARGPTGGRG
ncbi:hypothetical protein Q8A67_019033 [Cirrhinus molitorella]|uniref:Uncharacterized protein n=1 Tax=Cirrhinus molitorella TaxID=172907 RepID=A0AA88PDC5_9TELE|nr:hypothetical protein Q8A67_019033 [Cirrhinus molitorella]